jgi:hypothetical protein
MKNPKKTFIGGLVIGLLVGAILGGFTVAVIGATAFLNYELSKDTSPVGQIATTSHWTNK